MANVLKWKNRYSSNNCWHLAGRNAELNVTRRFGGKSLANTTLSILQKRPNRPSSPSLLKGTHSPNQSLNPPASARPPVMMRSALCQQAEASHSQVVARLHASLGEEAQVDFGSGAPTLKNGRYAALLLFKMVLSHSRQSYEETVWQQDVQGFIGCQQRAFEDFGGVPHLVRLDNLKSGVLKAHLYEPKLNPSTLPLPGTAALCLCRACHARPSTKAKPNQATVTPRTMRSKA